MIATSAVKPPSAGGASAPVVDQPHSHSPRDGDISFAQNVAQRHQVRVGSIETDEGSVGMTPAACTAGGGQR